MNKEDFQRWRTLPETKAWQKLVEEELADMGINHFYDPDSVEKTALAAAHLAGMIEGVELCLGIEPKEYDDE